jgi:hypothetical protein
LFRARANPENWGYAAALSRPPLALHARRRKKQVLVLNAARRFRHCAEQAELQKTVNDAVRRWAAAFESTSARGGAYALARCAPRTRCRWHPAPSALYAVLRALR